jgi:predicted nucleic acid-binding protein
MKVVFNSGPLINLAKVGQFTLLQDLFQHITIPPAVFEEVVARGGGLRTFWRLNWIEAKRKLLP